MKEQKAAEAVPEEHEEQETKGVKAEEQTKVPSPHTPVVSTPTNRANGEAEPDILRSRQLLRHHLL